jgi:hypothetical protein
LPLVFRYDPILTAAGDSFETDNGVTVNVNWADQSALHLWGASNRRVVRCSCPTVMFVSFGALPQLTLVSNNLLMMSFERHMVHRLACGRAQLIPVAGR